MRIDIVTRRILWSCLQKRHIGGICAPFFEVANERPISRKKRLVFVIFHEFNQRSAELKLVFFDTCWLFFNGLVTNNAVSFSVTISWNTSSSNLPSISRKNCHRKFFAVTFVILRILKLVKHLATLTATHLTFQRLFTSGIGISTSTSNSRVYS